ncbi:MAG: VanZ family protein [Ruminococcus sp.]|nr:VanZ family protein [Ruminococcus sp.]
MPWLAVAAWMTMIFMFSAQQADESLKTSGGFSEIFAKLFYSEYENLSSLEQTEIINKCQFFVRKAAHFSIYGVLGILTVIACKLSDIKHYQVIAALICLLYAASDELHQKFVEGRSGELRDVIIDFSGSLTGIFFTICIFYFVIKYKKRRRK